MAGRTLLSSEWVKVALGGRAAASPQVTAAQLKSGATVLGQVEQNIWDPASESLTVHVLAFREEIM